MEKQKKFFIAVVGIFTCYFYFGIFQEKINKGKYVTEDGEDEKFVYAMSLVLILSITNYIFSKTLVSTILPQGEDKTSLMYYCVNALTYILGMICSNMALQFVNYPTQVVAKSGKPIPVMILGVLLGKKTYPIKKYLFVFLVVTGVAMFMMKDKKSSQDPNEGTLGFGEILLILSLTMDGLTGAVQDRMRAEYQPKPLQMMVQSSFWSSIYLLAGVVLTGEIFEFVPFVQRHPVILWHLFTFSLAGALGQYCIFIVVSEFGPLPAAIITTTRKFFTLLLSVLLFGNVLLTRQWFATVIVFTGLFLDIMYGKTSSRVK